MSGDAFSKAWEVYQLMGEKRWGYHIIPTQTHHPMSLAKVSLGRLLASSAGFRFAWQLQNISIPLNDVLA